MKGFAKHKRTGALMLALLLFLAPGAASAATTISVGAGANKTTVQSGDTVEVTITVSGKAMAVAEGVFTYDPALLTYAESAGGASDGLLNMVSAQKGGADVLTARITFTAAGAGEARVEASIEKVLGYDDKEMEGGKADVTVTVSAPAPTPTPTPIDYAAKGVPAQNVKNATESLYIWRTLENVTVPSRYSETTLEYHGETVAAAQVEDSDAPTLLYLSNATGEAGGYYIYDAAADTLYRYQTVSSVSKSYILMEPDSSAQPPSGFEPATLTIDEKEYAAWKAQDAQGDIYLLYARNPDGEVGYYTYNPRDESFQRYAVMPARPVQPTPPPAVAGTPAPEQGQPAPTPAVGFGADGVMLSAKAFYAACGVAALLLIAVVWLLVARAVEASRRKRRAAERRARRERASQQDIEQ